MHWLWIIELLIEENNKHMHKKIEPPICLCYSTSATEHQLKKNHSCSSIRSWSLATLTGNRSNVAIQEARDPHGQATNLTERRQVAYYGLELAGDGADPAAWT
jgi:hypothetical protein